MARKESHRLLNVAKAAKDQAEADPTPPPEKKERITSGIHLSKDTLQFLRRLAVNRAGRVGGRPSVSALLDEFVQESREALIAKYGE